MKTTNSINDFIWKEKLKNNNKNFPILFEDYNYMGAIFKLIWTKLLHKVLTSNLAMREARTWVVNSSLSAVSGNKWVVSCILWNFHKYRGYNRKFQIIVVDLVLWHGNLGYWWVYFLKKTSFLTAHTHCSQLIG